MRRGPLAQSYLGAVGLVAFSLIPYLALVVGVFPLSHTIARSLGISSSAMAVTIALSTGAYAAGTVVAVQFAVHLRARRMLVLYELTFVIASILAAWAPNGDVFMVAFVAQGFCTSLMLIAAVPPLITRWPPERMPTTGALMNLCIFGAVAAGPTIGALQLANGGWRPIFQIVAGLAVAALLFSLLTFEDDPPQDRSAPWDPLALGLAVVGCGAAFFGAGELEATMTAGPVSLGPLIGGAIVITALVLYQHHRRNPLMPVRLLTTTVPMTGLFTALTSSAAAFGVMVLVLDVLEATSTPTHTAVLFLPEFVGAIVVAGVFAVLFRTRYTPVLALGGLVVIVVAAALLLVALPGTGPLIGVVAGLLGLGVAASVSPALFMAGFSLRTRFLQRVFAMIELMRAVTAFLVAPILVFLAAVLGSNRQVGTTIAVWICLGIAAVGFVGGCAIYLSGRPFLEMPDLHRWQGDDQPAWSSPPLFAALRRSEKGSLRTAAAQRLR